MLDHHYVIAHTAELEAQLKRRGVDTSVVEELKGLVEARRTSIQSLEGLRQDMNLASAGVQKLAKEGDKAGVERARTDLQALKASIKLGEESQAQAEEALRQRLLMVPNLPQASVPDGPDESGNRVERQVGTRASFDFTPRAHWDVGQDLGLVSFDQAAKISGTRFAVLRGAGARLERALGAFMLDLARRNGYMEIAPPLLVRGDSMMVAGQFPKFEGESFETLEREFVLVPTSEVAMVNMHRDDIFDESALPKRYTALTPCFRREAGAAGRDTRGLIRQHQFHKVELVTFATPESSIAELERLLGNAEEVLQLLKLPYQVVSLCTGDLGFHAAKTYDIEVWLPGQDCYREISSCSNCEDYQARRGQIRYRPADTNGKKNKPRLVHTLNGSALAVGRTLVAVLENYQQKDGSVRVPEVLVPYMGVDVIKEP